ncbi:Ger(x)C family spore germination protein [Paenibacillus tarimensis]
MKRNLNIRRVCALTAVLGLLTGCWDRVEVDDLAMVMGTGLDWTEDGQMEATVQIASPTGIPTVTSGGGGSGKKPVLTLTHKGKAGVDIMNRMQESLSRRLFLGHRGVIIIGEKYARKGVNQNIDQFLRNPDSRYSSYVLTAYGTTAKEIMSTPYMLEQIPAVAIKKMQKDGNTLSSRLDDFIDSLAREGRATITGAIRIVNTGDKGKIFLIDKAAVYREKKLLGFLNEDEMMLMLWRRGKIRGLTKGAQVEPPEELYQGTVGIRYMKAGTKVRTKIEAGKPHVTFELKARVKVLENDTRLNLSKDKDIKKIEQAFSENTTKLVKKTIRRSQKVFKEDIFGFGEDIHIQHPYYWKANQHHWKDIYTDIPVDVKVSYQIERVGRMQEVAHKKK